MIPNVAKCVKVAKVAKVAERYYRTRSVKGVFDQESGTPGGTRTHDLARVTRMLCPTELRGCRDIISPTMILNPSSSPKTRNNIY